MFYARRNKKGRWSRYIGRIFSMVGLQPNHWTILSLVPAVVSFYFLTISSFLGAAVFLAIAAFLDVVDGCVARETRKASKGGGYLDTVVDRYVEVIVIFGLLFSGLPGMYVSIEAWLFLYLFGSLMTTYSRAASMEIIKGGVKGGLLERAERLVILFIGMVLGMFSPMWLSYTIVVLAVLSNVSALQRIGIVLKK